jgi:hypothetical protein
MNYSIHIFYQALEALGRLGEGFVLPVLDLPLDDSRTFGAAIDNLRGKFPLLNRKILDNHNFFPFCIDRLITSYTKKHEIFTCKFFKIFALGSVLCLSNFQAVAFWCF